MARVKATSNQTEPADRIGPPTQSQPQSRQSRRRTPATLEKVAAPLPALALPTGKLGAIVTKLQAPGATLQELMEATGWQSHTVRAALSRLRRRGFVVRLTTVGDRQAYRLAPDLGEKG